MHYHNFSGYEELLKRRLLYTQNLGGFFEQNKKDKKQKQYFLEAFRLTVIREKNDRMKESN